MALVEFCVWQPSASFHGPKPWVVLRAVRNEEIIGHPFESAMFARCQLCATSCCTRTNLCATLAPPHVDSWPPSDTAGLQGHRGRASCTSSSFPYFSLVGRRKLAPLDQSGSPLGLLLGPHATAPRISSGPTANSPENIPENGGSPLLRHVPVEPKIAHNVHSGHFAFRFNWSFFSCWLFIYYNT